MFEFLTIVLLHRGEVIAQCVQDSDLQQTEEIACHAYGQDSIQYTFDVLSTAVSLEGAEPGNQVTVLVTEAHKGDDGATYLFSDVWTEPTPAEWSTY